MKPDVWSFGIVLTEIVTHGRTPYPGMCNQEVLQHFFNLSRSYCMQQPQNCPDRLYQIMVDCWKSNAEERPTFKTLKWNLENFFEKDVRIDDTGLLIISSDIRCLQFCVTVFFLLIIIFNRYLFV